MGKRTRFEIGAEFRGLLASDVTQFAVGVPLRFAFGVASNFEMTLGVTPGYHRIIFDSPYFEPANAFGARLAWGMQFPIGSRVMIGFSPATFLLLGSSQVDILFAYEPRLWVGAAFF
jgi:hypothetical protein